MLQAWRDFVEEVDPDVVIGYNIAGFDFPYLLDRAKALKANQFHYLGRLKSMCSIIHLSGSTADPRAFQTSKPRQKIPTFLRKPTDSVILKILHSMGDYNWMFYNSCNANTSFVVIP